MHTLLLVEDDENLVYLYQSKFTMEGFEVIVANTGDDGLKLALNKHPDIILLDILLPGMDGMTVMKKLREDSWGKDVPIIILTNIDPTDKALEQILHDHPTYYLLKANTDIDVVVNKVKEVQTSLKNTE